MTQPGDRLLNHFDALTGTTPTFIRASDDGVEPVIHVAIYNGFPHEKAITGFTIGLSHFQPPDGGHKEIMISMLDDDNKWAAACGFVAFQFHSRCPFNWGERINFHAQISTSSTMSAFVAVHPLHIPADESIIDIGNRNVELMQLVPLYEQERMWLTSGGDLDLLLNEYDPSEIMNPRRKEFVSP